MVAAAEGRDGSSGGAKSCWRGETAVWRRESQFVSRERLRHRRWYRGWCEWCV